MGHFSKKFRQKISLTLRNDFYHLPCIGRIVTSEHHYVPVAAGWRNQPCRGMSELTIFARRVHASLKCHKFAAIHQIDICFKPEGNFYCVALIQVDG